MAQGGDTITYTYSDGTSVAEDISAIDEVTVEYIYGAGGVSSGDRNGGYGGSVENAVIDVSNEDTLYIWVGGTDGLGRYDSSGPSSGPAGGGSTEIAFVDTNSADSSDEPHLAGTGGGGGAAKYDFNSGWIRGKDGGRQGYQPLGGVGGDQSSGGDGEGHVASRSEIIDSGTTTTGGGRGENTNGEVKLTYKSGPSYTVEVNGTEVKTIEVNGTEVQTIEVNGTEI